MRVWRFLQGVMKRQEPEPQVPTEIVNLAQQLLRIANESAQLAAKSTVLETRVSRLQVARDNLDRLRRLTAQYPRISLTSLEEFERGLSVVALEIATESSLHPSQRGGMHDGWEYRAAMLLSTPYCHLALHGKRDLNKARQPEGPIGEHGSWQSKLKTFRQIGVDVDEPPLYWSPHEVQIRNGDDLKYCEFLIAIRQIVECDASVEVRRDRLRAEISKPEWAAYSSLTGHHEDQICAFFFPAFLSTVPSLPSRTAVAMWDFGLNTPARIHAASDAQLLEFKGIGPAVLRKLRLRCAEITENRNESLLDLVSR